ncbi:hypothetical protein D3C85_1491660 [compost metagenome]
MLGNALFEHLTVVDAKTQRSALVFGQRLKQGMIKIAGLLIVFVDLISAVICLHQCSEERRVGLADAVAQ